MTRGKIIVVEGTDCSGKETQSKILIDNLKKEGMETVYYSFPAYETPTGRIVGLAYLGKPYLAEEMIDKEIENIFSNLQQDNSATKDILNILNIANLKEINVFNRIKLKVNLSLILRKLKKMRMGLHDEILIATVLDEVKKSLSHGWFPEGAPAVDPKISSLYYAADRAYNAPKINNLLDEGKNVILDRYVYSNLAHQGGKIEDDEARKAMYEWNCHLEFEMMGLPESDIRLFLHMPTEYASLLKSKRKEKLDENERDINHLLHAEKAYIEVAKMFDFETIECVKNRSEKVIFEDIKTPEEISNEVYDTVKRKLTLR